MKIKNFSVRPVLQRAYCPDCDIELEDIGVMLAGNPLQRQYACSNCGYIYTSHKIYPQIDFIEIEEEDVDV